MAKNLLPADATAMAAAGLTIVVDIAIVEVHDPGEGGVARVGSRRPIEGRLRICEYRIYGRAINIITSNTL